MDDISGKKFSLQDWVTRRAANQSGSLGKRGAAIEPLSIKKAVNGGEHHETVSHEEAEDRSVSTSVDAVVETSSAPIGSGKVGESMSKSDNSEKETAKTDDKSVSSDAAVSPRILSKMERMESRANPVQQLQIVRLLSDLGERLRQSEKEREILWKEIEMCRTQIGDLESKNSKSEKAYSSLEGQAAEKEDFIKGLLDKQAELEAMLKTQSEVMEANKSETTKFEERLDQKLSGIETTTGSAIVRLEDALSENNKLSKRIEQLSQDKARMSRKLEAMEETLTQTQETLKAKALVLLTDQALAAKTSLPQQPAWTGDDTLKMSAKTAEAAGDKAAGVAVGGLAADIASSINHNKKKEKTSDMNNTAFLAALVVLGIAGGVLLSQVNFKSLPSVSWSSGDEAPVVKDVAPAVSSGSSTDEAAAEPDQDALMSDIATLANKIEPAAVVDGEDRDAAIADSSSADSTSLKDATPVAKTVAQDGAGLTEFDKAIAAEDQALERFRAEKPKGTLNERIKADRALPEQVKQIENRAFAGDPAAQHDLAAIYTAGHMGVKVNYDRAAKWFTEAAYQNVANAQYNLAVLYHQGLGVAKNIGKAIDLYRVAAANGHPEAQYNLAIAYIEGVGAEYSPQIAAVYFQKSAAGGVVEAAYNLGLLHENGLLGESQPDEAVFWYTLAANKGNEQAKTSLEQLKSQLSMSDKDASRIVLRIAKTKPGFMNAEGQPALPDPVKMTASSSADSAAIELSGHDDYTIDTTTISQIQTQLFRLGYYKGMPNGEMTSSLKSAIKTYQDKHGLKADGMPSETLLVHILANETFPAAGSIQ